MRLVLKKQDSVSSKEMLTCNIPLTGRSQAIYLQEYNPFI